MNEYNVRIDDDHLTSSWSDGDLIQHTYLNELETLVKNGINENYKDIQKMETGEINIGSSSKLDGASLSRYSDEELQNSDSKVPTSMQVKQAIPTRFSDLNNDIDLVNRTQLDEKQDKLVNGVNIKTINGNSVIGEGNIEIRGTDVDYFTTITTKDYAYNKPTGTYVIGENGSLTLWSYSLEGEDIVYDEKGTLVYIYVDNDNYTGSATVISPKGSVEQFIAHFSQEVPNRSFEKVQNQIDIIKVLNGELNYAQHLESGLYIINSGSLTIYNSIQEEENWVYKNKGTTVYVNANDTEKIRDITVISPDGNIDVYKGYFSEDGSFGNTYRKIKNDTKIFFLDVTRTGGSDVDVFNQAAQLYDKGEPFEIICNIPIDMGKFNLDGWGQEDYNFLNSWVSNTKNVYTMLNFTNALPFEPFGELGSGYDIPLNLSFNGTNAYCGGAIRLFGTWGNFTSWAYYSTNQYTAGATISSVSSIIWDAAKYFPNVCKNYDETKTQVLKNINGVATWSDPDSGGGSSFNLLGNFRDFTSDEKALDLTNLDVGTYYLSSSEPESGSMFPFYFKITMPNGSVNTAFARIPAPPAGTFGVLKINTKYADYDPSSGDYLGILYTNQFYKGIGKTNYKIGPYQVYIRTFVSGTLDLYERDAGTEFAPVA